jgi:acetate kinase
MSVPVLLVLNAGSSSLKFALYALDGHLRELLRGRYTLGGQGLGLAFAGQGAASAPWALPTDVGQSSAEDALAHCIQWLPVELEARSWRLVGAGHRIVHGGLDFTAPVVVGAAELETIEKLVPLAPLHQPVGLAGIRVLASAYPELPQVACFDTTFHASKPAVAALYGLPRALVARGYLRYGFHGLACASVMTLLSAESPGLAAGRVLIAHLGSGASVTGVAEGRSVHHSMGWSALDGLVMATRCGSLDPGLVLALVREYGDINQVETLLYRQSGLLGLSGVSGDLREILVSDAPSAETAVEVYLRRITLEAGAATAAMQGIDTLVFSGGVGERSAMIRQRICASLAWLGVRLDPEANQAQSVRLEAADSRIGIRRLEVDEEAVIGRATRSLLPGVQ